MAEQIVLWIGTFCVNNFDNFIPRKSDNMYGQDFNLIFLPVHVSRISINSRQILNKALPQPF